MHTFFRSFFSYFIPLKIETREGELTKKLRVVAFEGGYHLDARGVNYSGGGLHKIVANIFAKKHFESYDFKNVLILGLGGGDAVSLICEKYKKTPRIVGIEGDSAVLEIGETYFNLGRFKNLERIHSDAIAYLETTKESFDFIMVDLFVDSDVPPQFHTESFAKLVKAVAAEKSVVMFNKMIYKPSLMQEMDTVEQSFRSIFPNVERLRTKAYGVENNVLWCDTWN